MTGHEEQLRREAPPEPPRRVPEWSATLVGWIVVAGAFLGLMTGIVAWRVLLRLSRDPDEQAGANLAAVLLGLAVSLGYWLIAAAISATRKRGAPK